MSPPPQGSPKTSLSPDGCISPIPRSVHPANTIWVWWVTKRWFRPPRHSSELQQINQTLEMSKMAMEYILQKPTYDTKKGKEYSKSP